MSLVGSNVASFLTYRSDGADHKIRIQQAPPSFYEPILKERLISFYDGQEYRDLPKLKVHLQAEWDKLETAGKAKEAERTLAIEGEEGEMRTQKLKE